MWCGIDKNVYFVYLKWRALEIFIKFACSGSEFESLISLLIFCLIESKSLCIWVLGSLALVVALILLPLYLCCFKIYFIGYENCNSCFLFICLFLLSIWLVNLSPSLCFESLCILACEVGLDIAYRWVLVVSFDWGI